MKSCFLKSGSSCIFVSIFVILFTVKTVCASVLIIVNFPPYPLIMIQRIIQPFCLVKSNRRKMSANSTSTNLKDKSGVDKIIIKKQPYRLLNTSRDFLPSCDASNFHKLVNESSHVRPNIITILYFALVCERATRKLAM